MRLEDGETAFDSCFAHRRDGDDILNDWLLQEFRERVSPKRKIILTDRLSTGLKAAGIAVTKREAHSEAEFLKKRHADEALTRLQLSKTLGPWLGQTAGVNESIGQLAELFQKTAQQYSALFDSIGSPAKAGGPTGS